MDGIWVIGLVAVVLGWLVTVAIVLVWRAPSVVEETPERDSEPRDENHRFQGSDPDSPDDPSR